jgi:hypothetical protein
MEDVLAVSETGLHGADPALEDVSTNVHSAKACLALTTKAEAAVKPTLQ